MSQNRTSKCRMKLTFCLVQCEALVSKMKYHLINYMMILNYYYMDIELLLYGY